MTEPSPGAEDLAAGSVHRAFEARARRVPDAVAAAAGGEALSFAELDRRANRLAHALRGLGAGPEARVGLALERGAGWAVGILGILKAGAAYVPLDAAWPAARLEQVARDAGLAAAVSDAALRGRLPFARERVVCLDGDRAALDALPDAPPAVRTDPAGAAYVIHTSGSTGRPKGVVVAHGAVLHLAAALEEAVYRRVAAGAPLRVGLNAPLVFDGSVKQWIQLLRGRTLLVAPEAARADPARMLAWIREARPDVLDCTPTLLRALLAAGLGEAGAHAPRLLLCGGEALDPATWTALRSLAATRVCNLYGPTEFTVDATAGWADASPVPTIGRELAGTRAYLLDEGLDPVGAGEPGELCLAGERLARGYLGRPELTAEKFVPDPFTPHGTAGARMYRTGDRARRLPCGSLEYLGRLDDQVKIRGVRIEPGEAAAVLREHPALRDAAVVARHEGGEPRLVAYTVARNGGAPSAGELRGWLRERLPAHLVPAAVVELPELPVTRNGKLDRAALPAPPAAADPDRPRVAPRTPAEEATAALWAETLGLAPGQVGAHDNFWELGGDSLALARLHARLQEQWGDRITLPDLFGVRTLAEMAARLERDGMGDGDGGDGEGGDSYERADARRTRARMHRAVRAGATARTNLWGCDDEQRG